MRLSEKLAWSRMPLPLRAGLMFVAYAIAAEIGNRLSVQNAFSTFWPPAGVALALLALSPRRDWPALLLAAAAANLSSDLIHGRALVVAVGFALANGAEASAGAYLLQRYVGSPPRLAGRRAVLRFALWAVAVGPMVGATAGASVVTLAFGGGWNTWISTWSTWWSGDALGVLACGAFVLVLDEFILRSSEGRVPRASASRAASYIALVCATCAAAVAGTSLLGPLSGWKFVIFLPAAILAALFGVLGTVTACLALTVSTSAALALGSNVVVLATGQLGMQVLVLQGFLAVISFTSLFMAVVVEEARDAAASERVLSGKYRALLEALPVGVTISDATGAIIETSMTAEAILGVGTDVQRTREIDGDEWLILRPDGSSKPVEEWVSVRALREGRPVREQEGVHRPDGSLVWLDVSAAPIPVEGFGVAIAYSDITEQVAASERLADSEWRLRQSAERLEDVVRARTAELERANEDLRDASEAKSRFLANVSHELRTPLNSVIGFTGVMLQGLSGPVSAEQAEQLRMVKRSGEHLLALVNDLLDLTRVESGRITLDVVEFGADEVLQSVADVIRPLAEAKGLDLRVAECPGDLRLMSDIGKVRQVLLNLAGNAVKFTDSGSVTLTCARAGEDVRFGVVDTGIGIPADQIPLLMDEFVQVERADGMKPEGTGLGLAISRRLALFLGGSLAVTSTPGSGSTFTLSVPAGL